MFRFKEMTGVGILKKHGQQKTLNIYNFQLLIGMVA